MTMVMESGKTTITATKLKAQLLQVLDEVAGAGGPVVVTKFGKPVARLVPIDDEPPLRGSVEYLVDDDDLIKPIDVQWNANQA